VEISNPMKMCIVNYICTTHGYGIDDLTILSVHSTIDGSMVIKYSDYEYSFALTIAEFELKKLKRVCEINEILNS